MQRSFPPKPNETGEPTEEGSSRGIMKERSKGETLETSANMNYALIKQSLHNVNHGVPKCLEGWCYVITLQGI